MTIIRNTKAIIFDNNDKYKSNYDDNYYYLDQPITRLLIMLGDIIYEQKDTI